LFGHLSSQDGRESESLLMITGPEKGTGGKRGEKGRREEGREWERR
jgi:hypothetical protein